MAICAATKNLAKGPCGSDTPGADAVAYYFNTDDVASFVPGTGSVIEDITFKSGKGFMKVDAHKGSVNGRSFIEGDQATGTSFTQEVTFRAKALDTDTRDFVQELKGPKTGWLIHSKSAGWQLFGYEEGLTAAQLDDSMLAGEEFGELVVMRATELEEKRRIFFDTDENTTLTNILSKVIAS